mgnify:CR=1 FL=1
MMNLRTPPAMANILKRVETALDTLIDYAFYVAAARILFVALIVGYEGLMRRVFNAPTFWVLQTAGYTLCYITFLSVARILKEDGHTRMSVVIENLPDSYARIINRITSSASAVICALLTWRTALSTYQGYEWNLVLREGYMINQYLIWWVIPFGFALLTFQFIRMTFGYRLDWENTSGL